MVELFSFVDSFGAALDFSVALGFFLVKAAMEFMKAAADYDIV